MLGMLYGKNPKTSAGEASGPEKLAHGAKDGQGKGEADADAQSVQGRTNDAVFEGECLGSSKHDAVNHDQGDEHAQAHEERVSKGRHHLFDNRYEGGDNHDETGDTDLGGYDFTKRGHQDIGTKQNEGRCQPHADAVFHGSGHAQGRTESKDKPERRNFRPKPLGEFSNE